MIHRRPASAVWMVSLWLLGWITFVTPPAGANHQGHQHEGSQGHEPAGSSREIPGASFQVIIANVSPAVGSVDLTRAEMEQAGQTVVDAFMYMVQHRREFPRFDESLNKQALQAVVVEPTVTNQDGRTFPFLVVRTADPGRVRLLISASAIKEKRYLGHPDRVVPVLAREFQWVVSKADTSPKAKAVSIERDLAHTVVLRDQNILSMSGEDRAKVLQRLFDTYLKTVDDQRSLEGQPYYEIGATTLISPTHSDSTVKLYDIRVREALQKIVREAYFQEHMPQAIKTLLNGKVWNVAFVKIDQRDWATRTRVLPEDKSVAIGEAGDKIQPAAILINTYRTAGPDDPFYRETNGLPMGALSAEQLARVIALEIQHNITEKSMTGHVAQDATTAPK